MTAPAQVDINKQKLESPPKLSLEEFVRLYDTEGPFEIIEGERIKVMPTVAGHDAAASNIFEAILVYLLSHKIGKVMKETTFVLPDADSTDWVRGSRIPDVMFYKLERLNTYKEQTSDWREKPYMLIPDLAVEVVSKNDMYSNITRRVEKYLEDGVKLIWIVDPEQKAVTVHQQGSNISTRFSASDMLSGEEVLPGFEMKIAAIFE